MELAKQKKNSLYTKKEYTKSVTEKVDEIKWDIQIIEESIKEENDKIKELENTEKIYLENINTITREL